MGFDRHAQGICIKVLIAVQIVNAETAMRPGGKSDICYVMAPAEFGASLVVKNGVPEGKSA